MVKIPVDFEMNLKEFSMSMHPSFKIATKIKTTRNVLKRHERVDLLAERGEWKEGDSAYGLKKTKPSE